MNERALRQLAAISDRIRDDPASVGSEDFDRHQELARLAAHDAPVLAGVASG